MSYTPAPWRVDLDFKHTDIEYHQIVALDGPRSNAPGFSITGCINREDAQLIAAAPDLLEALESLCSQIEMDCSIGSDPRLKELCFKHYDAIQIIRKAKGI